MSYGGRESGAEQVTWHTACLYVIWREREQSRAEQIGEAWLDSRLSSGTTGCFILVDVSWGVPVENRGCADRRLGHPHVGVLKGARFWREVGGWWQREREKDSGLA